MADYKKTLPKVIAQTHDEMNEEEKKSFSKKYEGNISHERDVKKFFKKQFKKLKGQVDGSNNDTTASCTPTSKSTDAQNSTNSQPTQNNGTQSADAASDEKFVDQDDNESFELNSDKGKSDTPRNNGNISDEESTETEEDADVASGTPTQVTSNQNINTASGEQFASQANDDGTEPNSDEGESDTPSNNGNIPDEESTETEKEETKALKNSDVSAGTSDMENEQKEENNNQETTSSN